MWITFPKLRFGLIAIMRKVFEILKINLEQFRVSVYNLVNNRPSAVKFIELTRNFEKGTFVDFFPRSLIGGKSAVCTLIDS